MHGRVCSQNLKVKAESPRIKKQMGKRALKQEKEDDVTEQLSE
jgi:hypothetical protein